MTCPAIVRPQHPQFAEFPPRSVGACPETPNNWARRSSIWPGAFSAVAKVANLAMVSLALVANALALFLNLDKSATDHPRRLHP
jgi:hypothetical protein